MGYISGMVNVPFADMTFSPSNKMEKDKTTKPVCQDIFAPSPLILIS
jgi:hypothetical protein